MQQTGPVDVENLCVSIVEAVAAERDVTPDEVTEPLYRAIDTDALERLFDSTPSGVDRQGEISFRYHGCQVVVDSERCVTVEAVSFSDAV